MLLVIALIPVGADISFLKDESVTLEAGIVVGPFRKTLYPAKPLTEEQRLKKERKKQKKLLKKSEKKKEKDESSEPKAKKPSPFYDNLEDIISLIKLFFRILSRFKKKIKINIFKLHIISGSDDPYNAVMTYGYINSVLGILLPLAEKSFRFGEKDIGTAVDFGTEHIVADSRIKTTIRVWEIVYLSLFAGISVVIHMLRIRKRRKSEMPRSNNSKEGNE